MTLTIEAIYEDGVLKPTQPISLPEGTRVSLVIEASVEAQVAKSPAAILAAIAALPLASNDQNFSNRDHDSVLYSTGDES